MLTPFDEVLDRARAGRRAAGAFTCYSLEMALAVSKAAEDLDAPVVFVVSADAFRGEGGDALLSCVLDVATACAVPACVQVDHVDDLGLIERAAANGAGAVMADGSRLPYDENLSLVRRAVAAAVPHDVQIEAELGRIEGDEEHAGIAAPGSMTDPELVPEFTGSGVTCLAVAIGNTHGRYEGQVSIDWDRLRAIGGMTSVHLSLHGASGLPEATLRRAVEMGISKVNVNTELRQAYLSSIAERVPGALGELRILELQAGVIDDLRRYVAEKIRQLTV